MKVTHYICPRQCGKTTFAENLQMEDPSLLLIEGSGLKLDLREVFNSFRGKLDSHDCYTGIIIDEFIPMTNHNSYIREKFLRELRIMGIEEIILISTPDKMYCLEYDSEEMREKFLMEDEIVTIVKTNLNSPINECLEKETKKLFSKERFLTEVKGEYLK